MIKKKQMENQRNKTKQKGFMHDIEIFVLQ